MNNFTKEELEYLAEAIEMWFKDYDSETPEKIYLKLKDMIDNYHYCSFDMGGYCSKCKGWRGMDGCYERD